MATKENTPGGEVIQYDPGFNHGRLDQMESFGQMLAYMRAHHDGANFLVTNMRGIKEMIRDGLGQYTFELEDVIPEESMIVSSNNPNLGAPRIVKAAVTGSAGFVAVNVTNLSNVLVEGSDAAWEFVVWRTRSFG